MTKLINIFAFLLLCSAVALKAMEQSSSKHRMFGEELNTMAQRYPCDLDHAKALLCECANANYINCFGHSTLMYAAEKNNLPLCELLIAYGADVNHADDYGWTALMWAITPYIQGPGFEMKLPIRDLSESLGICRLLINANANIFAQAERFHVCAQSTALSLAFEENQLEAAEAMLNKIIITPQQLYALLNCVKENYPFCYGTLRNIFSTNLRTQIKQDLSRARAAMHPCVCNTPEKKELFKKYYPIQSNGVSSDQNQNN